MGDKPKFGTGHAKAMARLGLRELREATMPFPESIAREELGTFGNPTPGEIQRERREEKEGREPEIEG